MNMIPIFSSFVVQETPPLDHGAIEHYCYEKLNGETSMNLNMIETELFPLYDLIHSKFNELHQKMGIKFDTHQVIYEGWINLNNREEITRPHCHPRSFFVAVYYPKSSDGYLRLENPNRVLEQTIPSSPNDNVVAIHNQYNCVTWDIEVRTGDLVIFPAWLYHSVVGHTNNEDRISIAFNSKLIHSKQ